MKKIFVITRAISFDDGVGGLERSAYDHIIEMHRIGYRVSLISPAKKVAGNIPEYISFQDVPWPQKSVVSIFGYEYVLWCNRVAKYIEKNVPEGSVLHFHGAAVGAIYFISKNKREKYKAVANPHGMEEFTSGKLKSEFNRFFIRWLAQKAKHANVIIATDQLLIDKVKKNINVTDDKILLIPNGVNILRLTSLVNKEFIKNIREKDDFIVLSLGRIEFNKGYDLLAKAISELNDEYYSNKKIKWIHLGRGSRKSDIEKIISSGKSNYQIIEYATDEEVNSYLSICDIFVQPSRFEGSSLTTLEAMAHGCIVIGTKVGGIPNKIINNETGFLTESVDSDSIKKTLQKVMKLDDVNSIKYAAKTFVEDNFDVSKLAIKYDNLYSRLTRGE